MSEEFEEEPSCGLWNDVIEEVDEIESDLDIGSLDGRSSKLEADPIFIKGYYSQHGAGSDGDNSKSSFNTLEEVMSIEDTHVGGKRLYLRDLKSQNQLNIANTERKRMSDEKLKFTDLKVSGYFVYDKDSPNKGKVYGTLSYESDSGTSDASFNEKAATREDGDGTTDEEVQGFQEFDIEEQEKSIRKTRNVNYQPQKYFHPNEVPPDTPYRVYEVNPTKPQPSTEQSIASKPKRPPLSVGEVMKPAVSVKDIAKLFEGSGSKPNDPFDRGNWHQIKKSPWVSMPDLADRPLVDQHPSGWMKKIN